MEPQIIDHYNEMPSAVNVIDKLNEENDELHRENEKLRKFKENYDKMMKKFKMPRIKVDTAEEYTEMNRKLEAFGEFIDELDYKENHKYIFEDFWNYSNSNYVGKYENLRFDLTGGHSNELKNNGVIPTIINKLDELTNHLNKEWCEYRVLTAVETYMGDTSFKLSQLIFGHCLGHDLPTLYVELSYQNTEIIDEEIYDDYDDQIINLCRLHYFHCEKCNKLSCNGEPEMYDNRLLCPDCECEN